MSICFSSSVHAIYASWFIIWYPLGAGGMAQCSGLPEFDSQLPHQKVHNQLQGKLTPLWVPALTDGHIQFNIYILDDLVYLLKVRFESQLMV